MVSHVFRHLFRGRIVGGIVRGLGAAVLAGVGFQIGSDAYKSIKKRPKKEEEVVEPEEY